MLCSSSRGTNYTPSEMSVVEIALRITVFTVTLTAVSSTIAVFFPRAAVIGTESRITIDAVIAMLVSSLLAIEFITRLMPCRGLSGTVKACEKAIRLWKFTNSQETSSEIRARHSMNADIVEVCTHTCIYIYTYTALHV